MSKIKTWAGKDGVAAVIVCTDHVPAIECEDSTFNGTIRLRLTHLNPSMPGSLNILRVHGAVVPVGLPVGGIKFDAFTLIFSELVIKGWLVATRPQVEDFTKVVAKFGIKCVDR